MLDERPRHGGLPADRVERRRRCGRRGHQYQATACATQSVMRIFEAVSPTCQSVTGCFRGATPSRPGLSHGFETETELTVYALELRMAYGELCHAVRRQSVLPGEQVGPRTATAGGSCAPSANLYISERPFEFFGSCALTLCWFGSCSPCPCLSSTSRMDCASPADGCTPHR